MLFFSLGAAETAFISGTLPLHTIPRTTETHPSDTAFDAGLHRKWKTEDGITVISLLAGEKELYIRADMRLGRKAEAVTKTPDTRFSAKEDAIVFYFDPNLMNRSHRFIGVNYANVVNDGVNNSFRRNYGVRTETKVADNAWRLYLAVSYAELGIRPEQGMVFGLNARQKHAFLSGSLNKPAEWLALSARYPQAELRIHSADGFLHIASDTLKQGVILYDSVNGIQTLVFPFQNGTGKVKPGGRNPPGRIPLIFLGSDGRGRRFLNRLYAE